MKRHPHGNRVRIIGGQWKSRVLTFAAADGLRPTPDRVRETLFNWLGQTLYGKTCLDLFAGSGALGFEALSRGAERVVMVESARSAIEALRRNAELLRAERLEIVSRDALPFLANNRERFDLIFLDPPYEADLLPRLFPLLSDRLQPDGTVYFESDRPATVPPGWRITKESRAGKVRFQLAERAGQEGEPADDQSRISGNV